MTKSFRIGQMVRINGMNFQGAGMILDQGRYGGWQVMCSEGKRWFHEFQLSPVGALDQTAAGAEL